VTTPPRPDGYGDRSPFGPRPKLSGVHRTFPLLGSLREYRTNDLRSDIVAGVTVGALALPSGMAFADIAGLPPVAGLYALLLPTVAYTLFGSSKQLIVGPEAAGASLVAAAVAPLADGDPARYAALAATLALLVGAIFLVAWAIRFGFVADYFSRAVLVGYLTGIGINLIAGQLDELTGIATSGETALQKLWTFLTNLSEIDAQVALVGGVSLTALLLLKRFTPRIPGPLVVVVAGVATSAALGLAGRGIPVIGAIPSGLPSIQLPSLRSGDVLSLLPGAIGIFLVSFGDVILTGRSIAGRHGEHVRANQEMFALGVANGAASITQAFAVGASGSRTAVNDDSGGRTQLSGLFAAATIAIVLLFLTGLMTDLPSAVLGAVIVAAAIGLLDPGAWRSLAAVARREVVIAAVAALGVLSIGILRSLVISVALALLDAILCSARPHDAVLGYVERLDRWADVSVHPSARIVPGIVVYRLNGRLFFANATYVRGRIAEAIDGAPTEVRRLVLDCEGLTGLDASGLDALGQVIDDLERTGILLELARLRHDLVDLLDTAALLDRIGRDHLHPTVRAAVAAAPDGGADRDPGGPSDAR